MDNDFLSLCNLRLLSNTESDLKQYLNLLSQLTKVEEFDLEKL